MQMLTIGLIVLIIVLYLIYDYWCHTYFQRIGIKEAPGKVPLFGNFLGFRIGIVGFLRNNEKACGKLYGFYGFRRPTLVIGEPDMLKEILVRNFSSFHDRTQANVRDAPFDKALTRLEGQRWKKVRNTCTPAFSANKLKGMSSLINRCCDNLINNLQVDFEAGKNIEVKGKYEGMTMDTIACCAFGMDVNSQKEPNHPFVKQAKALFTMNFFSLRVILIFALPFLRPLYDRLDIGIVPGSLRYYFVNVIEQAIEMRKKQGTQRRDILQLMMDAHKDQDEDEEESKPLSPDDPYDTKVYREPLTNDEIVAQAVTFFLAGYETTNVALMFLSYCLAVNPECQQKLVEEIDESCPDKESTTYETVNKLEYLEMCLNESLRMYPPGVVADRVCNQTMTINGLTIPKDMGLLYNIIGIHYDKDYWEEPEKFDPERFSKENKEKRHPYAYLPFGIGPRNCIGMRFALFEIKLAIVRVLQNFTFEPCEETEIPLKFGIRGIAPDKGVTLRLKSRQKEQNNIHS